MHRPELDKFRDLFSRLDPGGIGKKLPQIDLDGIRKRLPRIDVKRLRGAHARPAPDVPEPGGEAPVGESPESPAPVGEAASSPAEDGLCAQLREIPELPADGHERLLALWRPKVEDRGEDALVAIEAEGQVLLGAFDGCGGSGAKVYPAFGGHTGAWVASRAAAVAAGDWFRATLSCEADPGLKAHIEELLGQCKAHDPTATRLIGSLSKEFPTTVAAFRKAADGDSVDFYWCGDSRCYVLDAAGLHQVTQDDADIADAMRGLREDAPMTNVASASRPFALHHRQLTLGRPSVILAATDGCFGYLPSPMAFECALLETACRAGGPDDWKRRLDARIGRVSGDDYTLVAWVHRFGSFQEMKRTFRRRLDALRRRFPQANASDAELFRQWEAYRPGYECMLAEKEDDDERD